MKMRVNEMNLHEISVMFRKSGERLQRKRKLIAARTPKAVACKLRRILICRKRKRDYNSI